MELAEADLEDGEIREEDGGNGLSNVRRPMSAPANVPNVFYENNRRVKHKTSPPRYAGRGATSPRPGSSRFGKASARAVKETQRDNQRNSRKPHRRNESGRNDTGNHRYRGHGRRDRRDRLDASFAKDIGTGAVYRTKGKIRQSGSRPNDAREPVVLENNSGSNNFGHVNSRASGSENEAICSDSDSIKSIPVEKKIPELIVLDGSSSNDEDEETLQLRWLALEGLVKVSERPTSLAQESEIMAANVERTLCLNTSEDDDLTKLTYSRFASHLRSTSTNKEFQSSDEMSLEPESLPIISTSSKLDKTVQELSPSFDTAVHPSDNGSHSVDQSGSFGVPPFFSGPCTVSEAQNNQIGNAIQTLISSRRRGQLEEHTIPLFQTPDRGFWALSRLSTNTNRSTPSPLQDSGVLPMYQGSMTYPPLISNPSYHSIYPSVDQFRTPVPPSFSPLTVSPVPQIYHNDMVSLRPASPIQNSPQNLVLTTRHAFSPVIYHRGLIPQSTSISSTGGYNQPAFFMVPHSVTPNTQRSVFMASPSSATPSMFYSSANLPHLTNQNALPVPPLVRMSPSSGYGPSPNSRSYTGKPLHSQTRSTNLNTRKVTNPLPLVRGLSVGDLRITIPNKSLVINVGNESSSEDDELNRSRAISTHTVGLDRRVCSTVHDTKVHQSSPVSKKCSVRKANTPKESREDNNRGKLPHAGGEVVRTATCDVAGSIKQMLTRSRRDAEKIVLTEKQDKLEGSKRKYMEKVTTIPEKRRKSETKRENDSANSSQGLPEVENSRKRISPIRLPANSPELIPSVIKHLPPIQQAEYAVMKAKIIEYERAKCGTAELSATVSGENSPAKLSSVNKTEISVKTLSKNLSAAPLTGATDSSFQCKTALIKKPVSVSEENKYPNETLLEFPFSEMPSMPPEAQELSISSISSPDSGNSIIVNSSDKEKIITKDSTQPAAQGLVEASNLCHISSELKIDQEPALVLTNSNKKNKKVKLNMKTRKKLVKGQPKVLRKASLQNMRRFSRIFTKKGTRRHKPKNKEPTSIYNKEIDERTEADLRQRLLKATLLRKMAASGLQIQLAKRENELLSTRANTISDVNKLLDKVMQISVRKVTYRNIIAHVAHLREQMLKADQEAGLSRLTIQGMISEVMATSAQLQQKREICEKLSEECVSIGGKTSSCYKCPDRGNTEMISKLNELKRHTESLAKESVTSTTIYDSPQRRNRRSARGFREDISQVTSLEKAEQPPLLPIIKKEKTIGFTKSFFLPGSPTREEVFLLPSTTHDVLGIADVQQNDGILESFFEYRTPYTSKPLSQRQTEQVSIERLDPDVSLCSFELQGMCISDTCLFQHLNPKEPPFSNSTI